MSDNEEMELEEEVDGNSASGGVAQYTRKQILKEETEAPFRKIRLFFYFGLGASAALGTFITGISLAAVLSGARQGDLDELYKNLAINVLGLPVLGYLYRRDIASQNSLLERISKGGKLSGLKIKLASMSEEAGAPPLIVKVSDLRRDRGIERRVVIVAAPKALLKESLASSIKESKSLVANELLIVPLQIEEAGSGSGNGNNAFSLSATSLEAMLPEEFASEAKNMKHLGLPLVLQQWNDVIGSGEHTHTNTHPHIHTHTHTRKHTYTHT